MPSDTTTRAPRSTPDPDLVDRARAELDGDDPPGTLALLGQRVGASPWHLQRRFKAATGLTPRQYLDARKLARARDSLAGAGTVADAVFDAGYGSTRAFYDKAGALGLRPQEYRRGATGRRLRWTAVGTPVGVALVVASDDGVVALRLDDSAESSFGQVEAEFPDASLERDDEELAALADAVVAWFDGDDALNGVPLDVRATAFQIRVWEELRRIPRGETRTYAQVAEALGMPTGARAVARACATNPVGLTVPCHRVVRADGSLAGYRWGVGRKAELLRREADPAT